MRINSLSILILMLTGFLLGFQSGDYSSPEATFKTYKKALLEGDNQLYLDCLTIASKQMVANRGAAPALMRREYQDIEGKNYKVTIKADTAILEFVPKSEIAPPYFFKKEDNKWKIDLKRMGEEIVFDQNNHWHWR